jgi:hypothetical protein
MPPPASTFCSNSFQYTSSANVNSLIRRGTKTRAGHMAEHFLDSTVRFANVSVDTDRMKM